MKIILNKDVQNLGEEGDIREVAAGYARNYLIPKGFGVVYSKQNLALLEGRRKAIELRKEQKKERAAGVKDRIEAMDMVIRMTVGENGRLFGSVTNAMIAEELAKQGVDVERKRIEIPEHTIKTVGNFIVKVKLYGSEVASLKLTVAGPEVSTEEAAATEDSASAEAEASEVTEAASSEAEASEDTFAQASEVSGEVAEQGEAVEDSTEADVAEAEASEAVDEAPEADTEETAVSSETEATEPVQNESSDADGEEPAEKE